MKRLTTMSFRNLALLLSVFSLLFLASCTKEEESDELADLDVTVVDAKTNNPISDVIVGIYPSEMDANNSTNLLKSTINTNSQGISKFYSLESNRTYWISARSINLLNVRETDVLRGGQNSFLFNFN